MIFRLTLLMRKTEETKFHEFQGVLEGVSAED